MQISSLSRKLHCAANLEKDVKFVSENSCFDQVACSHLSDDHLVYDGNIILRAGETFALTLFKYVEDEELINALEDSARLLELAESDECEMILPCLAPEKDLNECLEIY